MREFVVFSRRGCHLCEEMLEQLEPLCRGRATITVKDIESREEWFDAYAILIPVLVVDGAEVCHYQLNTEKVLALLDD
jgi:hypothetical protein